MDGNPLPSEVKAHGTATDTTINSDGMEVVDHSRHGHMNTTINADGRLEVEGGTADASAINGPLMKTVFLSLLGKAGLSRR